MSEVRLVETGSMGRVAYARVAPNEDLVSSIEKLCAAEGFRHAFVRGALGSLVDACFVAPDGGTRLVRGPAVEIVSLAGEVRRVPAVGRRLAEALRLGFTKALVPPDAGPLPPEVRAIVVRDLRSALEVLDGLPKQPQPPLRLVP